MSTPVARGRYVIDLTERTLATAAQGAIGEVLVQIANWPQWAVVPIMAGAAVVKGWLAKFVTNRESASLAPGV